jgi:hypothetical protein
MIRAIAWAVAGLVIVTVIPHASMRTALIVTVVTAVAGALSLRMLRRWF